MDISQKWFEKLLTFENEWHSRLASAVWFSKALCVCLLALYVHLHSYIEYPTLRVV